MSSLFDRIDILVNGYELTARPIEFDYDAEGQPILVLKYETTCPTCGAMIQFGHTEHYYDGHYVFNCPECKMEDEGPEIESEIKKDQLIVQQNVVLVSQSQPLSPEKIIPFLDPVEAGIFDPVKV
jgi:hypothetical protein